MCPELCHSPKACTIGKDRRPQPHSRGEPLHLYRCTLLSSCSFSSHASKTVLPGGKHLTDILEAHAHNPCCNQQKISGLLLLNQNKACSLPRNVCTARHYDLAQLQSWLKLARSREDAFRYLKLLHKSLQREPRLRTPLAYHTSCRLAFLLLHPCNHSVLRHYTCFVQPSPICVL